MQPEDVEMDDEKTTADGPEPVAAEAKTTTQSARRKVKYMIRWTTVWTLSFLAEFFNVPNY